MVGVRADGLPETRALTRPHRPTLPEVPAPPRLAAPRHATPRFRAGCAAGGAGRSAALLSAEQRWARGWARRSGRAWRRCRGASCGTRAGCFACRASSQSRARSATRRSARSSPRTPMWPPCRLRPKTPSSSSALTASPTCAPPPRVSSTLPTVAPPPSAPSLCPPPPVLHSATRAPPAPAPHWARHACRARRAGRGAGGR
jgi:hypothetical protein